jgi:hypothetical protein
VFGLFAVIAAAVVGYPREPGQDGIPSGTRFELAPLPRAATQTGADLDADSTISSPSAYAIRGEMRPPAATANDATAKHALTAKATEAIAATTWAS